MLIRWHDLGSLGFERTATEFERLRREMDRALGHSAGQTRARGLSPAEFPRVGLFDAGDAIEVHAEVPGMAEGDLHIVLDGSTLTLRGKRPVQIPEGYAVHRQERPEASFARSFSLPCRVDAERAEARLALGVLKLVMPKAPELKPRQINVTSA